MMRLHSLYLSGFKSFGSLGPRFPTARTTRSGVLEYAGQRTHIGDITVLLGANGAGKSNVVALFALLSHLERAVLQQYIGEAGTAESILHYGSAVTGSMHAEVVFEGDGSVCSYNFSLGQAAPDTLVFQQEQIDFERTGDPSSHRGHFMIAGRRETMLRADKRESPELEDLVLQLLRGLQVYQFHDTSGDASLRKAGYIEDAGQLRSDAGNLAAYLYAMRDTHTNYYDRIVRTIRQVCPQFHDFELAPSARNEQYILLNWRSAYERDYLMGPHQLSDGTLRFMALATLLLQPPERLPSVIVLDEPELGQHPSAIAVLADLVRGVTAHSQVILATQSPTLVNHFDLKQIRPIEFRDGQSFFLDLDPADYQSWLEDYTTGELWQKDVFGGGPHHG